MEGFNRAISTAVDTLCAQLLQHKHSPTKNLKLVQAVSVPSATMPSTHSTDLVRWLELQPHYPKLYWRSRSQNQLTIGLGTAQQFSNQQATEQLNSGIQYHNDLRYFWLSRFDPSLSNKQSSAQTENPQPRQLLFLPQIELQHDAAQQQWTLSATLIDQFHVDGDSRTNNLFSDKVDSLILQLRQLRPIEPESRLQPAQLSVTQRHDRPGFKQWQHSIQQAKRCFAEGSLQKVVLARQTEFRYRACGNRPAASAELFWQMFQRWREGSVNCYQIAYQSSPEQGFISFTPERLFQRQADHLYTEAIAATLGRSSDSGLARQQARQLLSDSKSRHEHGLVAVEIGAKLEGLGVQLNHGCGTSLLKQNGLQHLHQSIQGRLPHSQMDAQLLYTLHPTAAVGGLPTEPARQFIRQHEPFERGYYAGCCGFFESDQTELAVTIRSAEFNYPKLTLYAGAGIVPQSDAQLEWQELEQKIALPLSLFEQHNDRSESSENDANPPSQIA